MPTPNDLPERSHQTDKDVYSDLLKHATLLIELGNKLIACLKKPRINQLQIRAIALKLIENSDSPNDIELLLSTTNPNVGRTVLIDLANTMIKFGRTIVTHHEQYLRQKASQAANASRARHSHLNNSVSQLFSDRSLDDLDQSDGSPI